MTASRAKHIIQSSKGPTVANYRVSLVLICQAPYLTCTILFLYYNVYTFVNVPIFLHRLQYEMLVGGVLAMKKEQFETVNGFSNEFWGWGGEDDDMAYR